jgi:hypothetical protein
VAVFGLTGLAFEDVLAEQVAQVAADADGVVQDDGLLSAVGGVQKFIAQG